MILLLNQAAFPLESIICIDPYFDGGSLSRKWNTVISNTPWSATLESIRTYLPKASIPAWAAALPPDSTTPVSTISKLIRELVKPILLKIQLIQARVKELSWSSNTKLWTIHASKTFDVNKIFLTNGSHPKVLDLSIPSIPLEVALDARRLSSYIEPHQKVLVFGTQHSGSIVMKNLLDSSAYVTAIYKVGNPPFRFARDGDYDGLKRDSAVFADDVMKGLYPIKTIASDNLSEIVRESRTADWVVYAIGFERNTIPIIIDGTPYAPVYDGHTGKLSCPNAWGFGIAYPSLAPDEIHWDVGISSFVEHISKQLDFIITL